MKRKFIFVVGGVMSSVGKGVAAASLGTILKSKGFSVTAIKADPYLNVDAGTMNPTEHGEVFVTVDGVECDQDIGNYERFLDVEILRDNYMTTGRVYESVIHRERNLEYEGKCVEAVPHIPEEIIRRIKLAARKAKADITIVEIGGTIGEYQNMLFFEAIRMMKMETPNDVALVMVSFLPVPSHIGEMKTKPTQNASRELNSYGLQADFILCRASEPIDDKRREKLAVFCNIKPENAISAPDVKSIYDIPINFEKENFGNKILNVLKMRSRESNLSEWKKLAKLAKEESKEVKIGVAGKYFSTGSYVLADSYISVIESIKHAAWWQNLTPKLVWLDTEKYEKDAKTLSELSKLDGVVVPGGFGSRGVEGKILVAQYCREHKIPYFGLCYGMQIATIEFARNVCKMKGANTTEIDPKTKYPVIDIMKDQKTKLARKEYGNTMRLGSYDCKLTPGAISYMAYSSLTANSPASPAGGSKLKAEDDIVISERHRHRYELNNKYRRELEKCGLVIAGVNPERNLVEIIEIKNHPFFVGTQFHPEFGSRPLRPHPLFYDFIQKASDS
ncbi:CTP synthase [Candidatus Berkelbacteria bacterium RIFOXYA2_FULL_43_10]|uniref:CTP synthase (glutamine hydrolyzing) n=1 Tax=Candidatus Berkelbacteria bacterium RIFOXYA2_FULL_43_10 TaxID=1797472 RepID=A0A1F5E6R0_9BACT|nr:MAG: CTP synthase [Candidatus Berkelbacteria bacterium RIFOXYA2_FULL_43_10]